MMTKILEGPAAEALAHKQFIFALIALALLIVVGAEANNRMHSVAALGDASSATENESATLPIIGIGAIQEWVAVPGGDALAAVQEEVCDANITYLEPRLYATSDTSFTVSLEGIPNGAAITSISVLPCMSAFGGTAASDVVPWYHLASGSRKTVKGTPYLFTSHTFDSPTYLSPTVFTIPSIIKDDTTTLTIGFTALRNGGGIRLSDLKVSATYLPAEIFALSSKPQFEGGLEGAQDESGAYYLDAVLRLSGELLRYGGELEVMRNAEGGTQVGVTEFAAIIPPGTTLYRYPLVIGGIPRADYAPGLSYTFRLRVRPQGEIAYYTDTITVRPEGVLLIAPPTDVRARWNDAADRVEVDWEYASDESLEAVAIERAPLGNALVWEEVARITDGRSFLDRGLQGGDYFYRIRAVRAHGEAHVFSPYTPVVAVRVE